MDQPFDPYLKWLGIPPKQQPPNDYRLLGIELFESDPDVISNAADQRMAHLKNFSVGQHSQLSQEILNEIAAARVRLLSTQAKAEYDVALRKRLKEQPPAAGKTSAVQSPAAKPRTAEGPEPLPVVSIDTAEPRMFPRRRRRWQTWVIPAAIGLGVVAAVLVMLLFVAGREKSDSAQAGRPGDQAAPAAESDPEPGEQDLPPTRDEQPRPGDQPPGADEREPQPDKQAAQPDQWQLPPSREEPQPGRRQPQPKEEVPQPDQPDSQASPLPKISEPAEEAKRSAEKEIRGIYAKEFRGATTPESEVSLADKLRRAALDERDQPEVRFVLLQLACDQATKAGDQQRSLGMIDQMGQWYEVDVLGLKADALATVARSVARRRGGVAANRQVADAAEQLADQALSAANLRAADRLLKTALSVARRLKDKRRATSLQAKIKGLPRLEAQSDSFQKAVAALKENPDDREANLVAGSWYCFAAGDWEKGLARLGKGRDDKLAEIAKRDMSNPQNPKEQAELGHRWWELSEAKKGIEALRLQGRAAHWYEQALPRLSGLEHTRLKKQLDKIGLNLGLHALKFDGQRSHVVIHNFGYAGLSPQGRIPITVEAIVKPAGGPGGNVPGGVSQSEQVIFGNLDASGLALGTESGRWSFTFHYSYKRNNTVRSASSRFRDGPVVPGKWVHVAGVYDTKGLRLYVDGRLGGSSTLPHPHGHKPSALPFLVGARPQKSATPHVTGFFNGLIKAIRVSYSARYTGNSFEVPAELEADANSALLLLLSEGKGSRVQDASGSSAFGVIQGADWADLDASDLSAGSSAAAKAALSGS